MEQMVLEIAKYLNKKYRLPMSEAYEIVYLEWEFIEEILTQRAFNKTTIKIISEQLIDIYMVA